MSLSYHNNNNLESAERRKSKEISTGNENPVKQIKKKTRFGLFSFRSKKKKVVKTSIVTDDASDAVSMCSEVSTSEEVASLVEAEMTEERLTEKVLQKAVQQVPFEIRIETEAGDICKEDFVISQTTQEESISAADSTLTNEDDSSITVVTTFSEDRTSLTEKEEFMTSQMNKTFEASPENMLAVGQEILKKDDSISAKKAVPAQNLEKDVKEPTKTARRPNTISVKNSEVKSIYSHTRHYQFNSPKRETLTRLRQKMTEQMQSGSAEGPSLPLSPMKKQKTKRSKMPRAVSATHHLTVLLQNGENLAARDSNGLSDPYVKFKINGKTQYKSKICKATLNPKWDEEFTIPVRDNNLLMVRVFDHDLALKDDFIGYSVVDLKDLLDNEETELALTLEDSDCRDEDLGVINLILKITSLYDEVDASLQRDVQDNGETLELASSGSFKNTDGGATFSRSNSNASDASRKAAMSNASRKILKSSIATATVQLVSGKSLPARDSNGLSDPYVKLQLGKQRHKSKVCYKTLDPVWKEEYVFQLTGRDSLDRELSTLELTVWDKDSYRKDDFMGRCELELWSLEYDRTHSLTLNLADSPGTIKLLVTLHSSKPAMFPVTSYELSEIRNKFALSSTFANLSEIGFVEIRIIKANNCRAADINGKSDPYCVVELCNMRVQTATCYKTLDPVWNKTVTFPVYDIHEVLEVSVHDEDEGDVNDFLGRVAIPLLRVHDGEEKSYVLKDRKLMGRTKGTITLQIRTIYNPIRAAIRSFSPREEKVMKQEPRFKRQLLYQNFHRVWDCVQAVLQTAQFINSCFTWQNPMRSAVAFIVYLLIVWNIDLYMLPILLLLLLIKNYISVIVQRTKVDRRVSSDDQSFQEDDDEEIDDSSGVRLSLMQRLNALQEVLLKVQNVLDWAACLLERIHGTFMWSVPFLSFLACIVLAVASLIFYLLSFRTIAILWGINKFTKRLRKPNYVPNNELLDFLSRVPSEVQLDQYQDLSLLQGSPKTSKKKK